MDEHTRGHRSERVRRTVQALTKNNMGAHLVENGAELLSFLQQAIPYGATVGVGDSVTLKETGVLDLLRNGNYVFLDKYREGLTAEEKREIYLANFAAKIFLCSANAVTENGEIFNIDGNGSRVAPLLYGPHQVFIVIGVNKIVTDMDEAIRRARGYSAPLDARRLGKKTPCATNGVCTDCNSPDRICNSFVAIRRQFVKDRIRIVIVNANLGY